MTASQRLALQVPSATETRTCMHDPARYSLPCITDTCQACTLCAPYRRLAVGRPDLVYVLVLGCAHRSSRYGICTGARVCTCVRWQRGVVSWQRGESGVMGWSRSSPCHQVVHNVFCVFGHVVGLPQS